ncbi:MULTISPECIES: GNAT family N-acetyltransferase [unclassified Curtobacterium]|uniref:GNAT family N-acetyltransferase n=1 Tax=unclassified Curtobacterium TaxID=257496 RepID=UPI0037FA5676
MGETMVLPAGVPERAELEAQGWTVVARSFGAQLDAERIDRGRLDAAVAAARAPGGVRELGVGDVDAVLRLDAETVHDYPGSSATRHEPLDRTTAAPTASRRAFGAFAADGALIAMSYVDVEGTAAETLFTVVHPAWRRRGLGVAVKAVSVVRLVAEGVVRFRTGGSLENTAILRANEALGYARDEEWVTLERA